MVEKGEKVEGNKHKEGDRKMWKNDNMERWAISITKERKNVEINGRERWESRRKEGKRNIKRLRKLTK